jgi:hypothetical protein
MPLKATVAAVGLNAAAQLLDFTDSPPPTHNR